MTWGVTSVAVVGGPGFIPAVTVCVLSGLQPLELQGLKPENEQSEWPG
jgi:hypothetical protein